MQEGTLQVRLTKSPAMRSRCGVFCLVSALAPFFLGAAFPPRYGFKTLETGRVRVHFHAEVEGSARVVASLAEEILPKLEARYSVRVPRVEFVVHDSSDSPNGLASSFPYPYVEIRVAAPEASDSGPIESWLRLVVTHELTHIVQVERAGGLYKVGRKIFGRAPLLFPNALQPTWFIEGLAVREETRETAFGRGRHTYTKMLVDEAALSGQLEKMDVATLGLDAWPLGNAPYLFGETFLDWLEATYGDEATARIVKEHSSHLRPYLDSGTFKAVTGKTLETLWREFSIARRAAAGAQKQAPGAATKSISGARAAIQIGVRFSPDGTQVAYTSRRLDHFGEIRIAAKNGSFDRALTSRASGSSLAWSPDGGTLVFDESDVHRMHEVRSDLFRVDTHTGHRERLTRGARVSDPDVNERGHVVVVRRHADRSELAVLPLTPNGDSAIRDITRSDAGVEWAHPRWRDDGKVILASRTVNGTSDLVAVNAETGDVSQVTRDRAVDAEGAWITHDRAVFRSDREGSEFRLFTVDTRTGDVERVNAGTRRNAFAPDVTREKDTLAFSRYTASGFRLATTPWDPKPGEPAPPFVDTFAAARENPPPLAADARSYSGHSALWPRFWSPIAEKRSGEWRFGATSASFDPLQRFAWAGAFGLSATSRTPVGLGLLRYDRFTPTFTLLGRLDTELDEKVRLDTREARLSVTIPLQRTVRSQHTLSLVARRKDAHLVGARFTTGGNDLRDATLAAVWSFDSTKKFPMSISHESGIRARVAFSRSASFLGAERKFEKAVFDVSAYPRIGSAVIASHVVFGTAFGKAPSTRSFSIGGFASPAILDPTLDEPAILRGYVEAPLSNITRFGTRLAAANLEVRLPLAHPQRGYRAFPFFVRHLHVAAFVDAAGVAAPGRPFAADTTRVSVGGQLGADLMIGHRVPLTVTAGIGHGLTKDGVTRGYARAGLAF